MIGTQQITVLDAAIMSGNIGKVISAVEAGADINNTASMFLPPLLHAISFNDRNIVEYLIGEGADINIVENKDGDNAIICAAEHADRAMLDLLLSAGADIEKCNNDGWNGLAVAIKKGNLETAQWMVDHGVDSCNALMGKTVRYDQKTLADINAYILVKREMDSLENVIQTAELSLMEIAF